MPAIKKLLVPVDFSETSKLALRYALDIAPALDASVHVLHCWDVPLYALPDGVALSVGATAALMDETQAAAEAGVRKFLTQAGALKYPMLTWEVVSGRPYGSIVEVAERGFDLIVMGTHGRTGLSQVLLGSVAERVLRHAPCPVLTIREPVIAAVAAQ